MSIANINEYTNKLSSRFNRAVKEELIYRNPARGLRITLKEMRRHRLEDEFAAVKPK